MAKLSIFGLYQWDPTIFDVVHMAGDLDRETFVDNLLLECAEFSCIYPNPDFAKRAISAWSRLNAENWDKLYETMHYDYNPIWNKDGVIRETVIEDREYSEAVDGSSSENVNHNATDTRGVSAFNSGAFANSEQDILGESTGRGSEAETDTKGTDDKTTTLERIEQGNIGVTSTQSLIQEQREVVQFNLYRVMIDSFKERFCVLTYAI